MLSALIWIPMLGAIVVGLLPSAIADVYVRRTAILAVSAGLTVSLFVAAQFDVINIGLQFQEDSPWLESLGLTYQLGLDGLSLPLIVLNSFLTLIALFSTSPKVQRPRLYYALVLVINAAVAGAFLAHNLLLFFLFYELELIPLYLLIGIWGGVRRGYASTKFLIY
ncbi:MAG TPA: proton-conducting transporter membrane subunit, partial [Leptolyngbya sp.]|nr:proton-conducting transporter membrane subunit [Leptolyngbya sp.]